MTILEKSAAKFSESQKRTISETRQKFMQHIGMMSDREIIGKCNGLGPNSVYYKKLMTEMYNRHVYEDLS